MKLISRIFRKKKKIKRKTGKKRKLGKKVEKKKAKPERRQIKKKAPVKKRKIKGTKKIKRIRKIPKKSRIEKAAKIKKKARARPGKIKRTSKKKPKLAKKALIFDMDGVLVNVSESYRACIKKSAEFFLGIILDPMVVEEVKNRGGFNDDYGCVQAILDEHERFIEKDKIIKKFQEYYVGRNWNGLVKNEKWLLDEKAIKKLAKKFRLAIFTGRPSQEAMYALERFRMKNYFKVVVAREDIEAPKPNPEGLKEIMKKLKVDEAVYIGDVVDDAIAAKNAEIEFIGVIPPGIRNKQGLKNLLKKEGAKTVLNNINDISKAVR